MRKIIFLLVLFISYSTKIFSQTPLTLLDNLDNEIWLEGQLVLFNGWPPNVRMIVMDNYIIGIDEKCIPEELEKYLSSGLSPKGKFKLKLLYKMNLPYYEKELLVFKIIEYTELCWQ